MSVRDILCCDRLTWWEEEVTMLGLWRSREEEEEEEGRMGRTAEMLLVDMFLRKLLDGDDAEL